MIVVMVAGGFDPLHPGHISHLREAAKLGDCLVVALQPDENMVKKKGFCYQPYLLRESEIRREMADLGDNLTVFRIIDTDGTVTKTLEAVKPNIFAKGGDRNPDLVPIPSSEIDACHKIGCQIIYNVGEPKRPEWSSTLIGKKTLSIRDKLSEGWHHTERYGEVFVSPGGIAWVVREVAGGELKSVPLR